ncbi:MAG: LLM class F420-dependent oxidoreductase [Myxococcales bacterium]|nr:LLM class F420-dependent oxidoreductase [Myxococcales bacterium]
MELGVVFPQTEIGNDPIAIRDFAQAAEGLGFGHLLAYDHVLGADPDRPGGWQGRPYDKDTPFHEPFVLFGYLAGCTTTLEFVSAVIILPQRQTALVAKQAAEVDVLSSGRLRLGVGTGWNEVEYEALGENFHDRGKRQEEQIELMRRLWAEESLSFEGRWHRVTKAGINPRPEATIPIWLGGMAEAVIDRAARIADGWMPLAGPNDASKQVIEKIHAGLEQAGRKPEDFGIQAQAQVRGGDPDRWRKHAAAWERLGATHLAIATMNAGLATPEAHIDAIRRYREALS